MLTRTAPALISILGLSATLMADASVRPPSRPVPAPRPRIEVVFVIDTTGSMSGLIDGAKAKVWSIARLLAAGQPAPEIAIGLVAYRDRGDAYVTQRTPLSNDLDRVYKDLMALAADGGGDGPEHVNEALRVAANDITWSPAPGTTRIVFLVGDAPPHMDYDQDTPWMTSVETAVRKGITINSIRCGADAQAGDAFQAIARRGEGRFVSLAQDGGMNTVLTPFDTEIAGLRARLAGTYLSYGARDERVARGAAKAAAEAMPAAPAAAADRAAYLSVSGASLGERDLVEDAATGTVDPGKLAQSELPDAVAALPPAERRAKLEAIASERTVLEADIARLARQRDAFLAAQSGATKADAFDTQVLDAIREQAGRHGIRYE